MLRVLVFIFYILKNLCHTQGTFKTFAFNGISNNIFIQSALCFVNIDMTDV
jgi:hypothetical protein